MTVRSVIIGLILAVAMATLAYANDQLSHLGPLMANHFPLAAFGPLILLVAVNPLLGCLRKGARLHGKELAVIVAMVLAACSIPRLNFAVGSFTQSLVMPKVLERTDVSWQKTGVLDYVPPALMPGGHDRQGVVVDRYLTGRAKGDPSGLAAVPWEAWRKPLAAWTPLFLLLAGASICLALVVHPQWALHERLRYPIAILADFLLRPEDRNANRPIWRDRAFLLGVFILLFIYLVNGLYAWFPRSIEIPLQFDFSQAMEPFPWMKQVPLSAYLFNFRIVPTFIAFGTLLASDVGLSLGLSHLLYVIVMAAVLRSGVPVQEDPMRGELMTWQIFGSFLGFGLLLLYNGRRYYGRLATAALTPGGASSRPDQPVWAARGLFATIAAMTALLASWGMPWFVALLTILLLMLMYLVVSRLVSECGLVHVRSNWMPASVVMGLFGAAALGPQAMLLVMLLSVMVSLDPQVSLMPYIVTGLKIGQDRALSPRRLGWVQTGTYALVLGAVLAVALALNYNYGIDQTNTYRTRTVPGMPFTVAADEINKLQTRGVLEQSKDLSDWQRLTSMRPSAEFLQAAAIGLALVAVFSALRLRLPWWPLHPLIFLIWGSSVTASMASSYLMGWIVRTVTFRLGGAAAYRKLVAFMIGVIAGQIIGIMGNMVVGTIYYLVTGLAPPAPPG